MAEWLYEAGIGENRAILVESGEIIEAEIELPGWRVGAVGKGRLTSILIPGRRGIVTLDDQHDVLIEPLPGVTQGAAVCVEIMREAIAEPDAVKRAKGRITDRNPTAGLDLAARIGPHRNVDLHQPDDFEQAGWSECLEHAADGKCPFPGGWLRIARTPAMTLIDIDGTMPPEALALAGAKAAAQAIRRFGIAGNIGIDLPTIAGKAERRAVAAAFDAVLPPPFERTAVNGFGFLQVIRPRTRASLIEVICNDRAAAEARALIRQTQRSNQIGAFEIMASPAVAKIIGANSHWLAALSQQFGGTVTVKPI